MGNFYQTLKDSIQEGVIVFDTYANVIDINKNIEMTMDCSLIEGVRLNDILPDRISEILLEMARDAIKKGFSVPRPVAVINKNGVRIPFLVSVELIEDNVVIAVFKELISNEEMHKFAWENEIKGHYLSIISKSLYLPLHNIERNLEYAWEAMELHDGIQLKEFIADAKKELRKIANIFESILDLSIVDSVTSKVLFKTVNLNKIIRKVVDIASADFVNVEFVDNPQPVMVLGDVKSLEYLFLAIIDQQLQEASPSDTITVEVVQDNGVVRVFVRSTSPVSKMLTSSLQDDQMQFRDIKLDIANWIIKVHGIELEQKEKVFSLVFRKEA